MYEDVTHHSSFLDLYLLIAFMNLLPIEQLLLLGDLSRVCYALGAIINLFGYIVLCPYSSVLVRLLSEYITKCGVLN